MFTAAPLLCVRRVTAMGRRVHKNIRRGYSTETCVKRILHHYQSRGEYMMGGAEALARARAAPPAASANRRNWEMQQRPAGPVALLLLSIGIAGMTMDEEVHVWGHFGSISITDAPIHLYRTIVSEAASAACTRELSDRRPDISPADGIDWALTRPLWSPAPTVGAATPSTRHMLAYAAGGHWRQHRIKAAHIAETENCLLCGGDRGDDGHIWICAGLQHIRDKHPLVTKCYACLPTSLRSYGIAPTRKYQP